MTRTGFPARLRTSHETRRMNTSYRRNGKLQSCEPCRKGKLRCDHMMPTCGRCARRNKAEQCIYHPAPLTRALPTPHPSESDSGQSPVSDPQVNEDSPEFVRPIPTGTPGSLELPRTQQFFQRMKSISELALAMQNPFPIPVVPYRGSTYRRVQISFFY